MNVKRPLAIVFGITSNWTFAAGTVLLGLQKHKLDYVYDVIIYQQSLGDEQRQLLEQVCPCTFIEYDVDIVNAEKFARVSKMAFSRYECFGLLEKYRRVLWLDADIVIKGDISDLIDSCSSGIAMYKHENTPISVSFSHPVPGFDMTRECFNDGIFLLTDRLANPTALRRWCYEKTNEWSDAINSDQAIINLLLQEFALQVSELDVKYNCPPNLETPSTVILHPWGKKKFWAGYVDPLWDRYYAEWRALGGDGPMIKRGIIDRYAVLRAARTKMRLYARLIKKGIRQLTE